MMFIHPEINNLIERLQRDLNLIEQDATEAINLLQNQLVNYPSDLSIVRTFAILGNHMVFVEVFRRRIDYTRVILTSEKLTDEQIREVGESLSEFLGQVLEAKIVVRRIKNNLED